MAKTYINGMTCKGITGQYGEFFNISLNLEKLQEYVNDKGYVNVVMSKRKEVGQYGDTHYCTLNEWKPKNADQTQNNDEEISIEDIPF